MGYPTPHNNVWLNIKGNILNVNCTYFKVSEIMSFANAIQNTEGFKKCFQGLQASVRKLKKFTYFFYIIRGRLIMKV